MKNLVSSISVAASLVILAAGVSGCTSGGVKSTDSAVSSMTSLADQLEKARAQVANVMTSLNTLTKQEGDIKKNYDAFKKEVGSLEKIADGARNRADKMKASVDSHNQLWEEELQKITNEDLKQQSAERRAAVMKEFADIRSTFTQVSVAFKPFQKNLTDLVTYLGTDLSPAGISGADSIITQLKTTGVSVQNDIKAATEEIRSLQSSLGR